MKLLYWDVVVLCYTSPFFPVLSFEQDLIKVYGDGPNGYKPNAYLSSRTSCDCFYDFIYNIHAPSQSINVILSSYIQTL